MGRGRHLGAWSVAVVLTQAACNLILGNPEPVPTNDSGSGGREGGAPGSGGAPDGGTGGTSGSGGGSGGGPSSGGGGLGGDGTGGGSGGEPPVICTDGDYELEGECEPWTTCQPGEYVEEDGTPLSDRECAPCSESFSATTNAEGCTAWTSCAPWKTDPNQPGSTTENSACVSSVIRQFGSSSNDIARGIAVDGDRSVYVLVETGSDLQGGSSAGGADVLVRKYDRRGTVEATWPGAATAANDQAAGLAVTAQGSIYVVGATLGSLPGNTNSGNYDAFVVKLNANGEEEWHKQFGTGLEDRAMAVAVNANGDVYVVGFTNGDLDGDGPETHRGLADFFVVKYSGAGTQLWLRQYGTTGNEDDKPYDVAVDGAGNVYVVGDTTGAFGAGWEQVGQIDAFVQRYDANGTRASTAPWPLHIYPGDTPAGRRAGAKAVAVDGDGNIYVAGETNVQLGQAQFGGFDAYVRKYNSSGTVMWTEQIGTTASDGAADVVVDGEGDVYVTGETNAALFGSAANYLGGIDVYVRKYDQDWLHQWTLQPTLSTSSNDAPHGIAVDGTGAVYVVGESQGALPGQTRFGTGADQDAFVLLVEPP